MNVDESNMKKRLECFDLARGLLILWMLVVHVALTFGIIKFRGGDYSQLSPFVWLSWFMVPFFVFSGYFFDGTATIAQVVKRTAYSLMLPYLVWTLFGLCVYEFASIIAGRGFDVGIFYTWLPTACFGSNTPLWFLFSLLAVRILYCIAKKLKCRFLMPTLSMVALLAACVTCNKQQILGYGNVCLGFFFYHMGTKLRQYEENIDSCWIAAIAAVIFVVVPFISHVGLWFVLNLRPEPSACGYMLNIIFSLCGCYLLWFFAKHCLVKVPMSKVLVFLGVNSILLYVYHRPVLNFLISPLLRRMVPGGSPTLSFSCAIVILLGGYLIMLPIVSRTVPWALGMRKSEL